MIILKYNSIHIQSIESNRKRMMTEEDSPHQEFCFNDTKFIFYIDNPLPKKSPRPTTTLSYRKKMSENRHPTANRNLSTKNDTQSGISFPHSRRSAMQSITNRKGSRDLQSQRESRNKKPSPISLGIPCISKVNTQPCSPLLIKPLNLKKIAVQKQQRQQSLQAQKLKTRQSQKIQEQKKQQNLSIYDILRLFGEHHTLYRQGEDFFFCKNRPIVSKQSPMIEECKNVNKQEKTIVDGIKMKKVSPSKQQQFTLSVSRVSGQYMDTFHHQRAPILTYIRNMNPCDRKLYFLYTKSDSEQLKDKIQCDSSIKKQTEWVKILPYISMNLYPEANSKFVPHSKCPCNRPIPFIEFIKTLYSVQSDLITRLMEPPVANIYSIWLYSNHKSNFIPVLVDPYFLMHQSRKSNFNRAQQSCCHCSTLGYPYLWLPIMVKAILKVLQLQQKKQIRYGSQDMDSIWIGEVYHMLTGLTLEQHFGDSEQMNLNKNRYVIVDEDKYIYVVNKATLNNRQKVNSYRDDGQQPNLVEQIVGYNYSTGIKKCFNVHNEYKIYKLPNCTTWFSYSLLANHNCLTKYELEVERNTDFIFQHPHQPNSIRVYLYQQVQQSQKKTRLILKMEGKFSTEPTFKQLQTLKFKIKTGKYKLFVEHGEKKIHIFFNQQPQTNNKSSIHQHDPTNHQISTLSVQSSHQIKIGDGEILQRNNNGITEDSNFLYQKNRN